MQLEVFHKFEDLELKTEKNFGRAKTAKNTFLFHNSQVLNNSRWKYS